MRRLLLAAIAGAVAVLAFAPFNFWWLGPASLAALFWMWREGTPGECLRTGFAWGFGLFICGVSWVFISLQVYGQMPVPLAVVSVAGFVAYLALFPAAAGYLQARFASTQMQRLVVMPLAWVLLEWLRGWMLTGFPWLNIGYSQAMLPLGGYAPLGGIYLVSLVTACLASLLVLLVTRSSTWPRGLAGVAVIFAAGWALPAIDWVQEDGEPVRAAAVQANISLSTKWLDSSREEALETYLSLSPVSDIDLVVWPETAVSWYIHAIPGTLWTELAARPGDYVFGTIEALTEGDQVALYNSVVLMCGAERQVYRKRHLVPFGEYMPLTPIFGWILEYLHIPMSDFSSWTETQPAWCAGGARVSASICYEDAFAGEMQAALGNGNLLVNVSEDAWFGDSLAPHQRLQMARMRSVELGRPMIRASNTGPSVIIDHRGEILATTEQFATGVARADVQPMTGLTPYGRWGDRPVVILVIALLVLAGWKRSPSRSGD